MKNYIAYMYFGKDGAYGIGAGYVNTEHEKPTENEIDKMIDELKEKNKWSSVLLLNMIPVHEEPEEN